MATNPTPPLVKWSYADWRRQATDAERLDRLRLHMEEVSGFVLESMSKGRSLRIDSQYLSMLQSECERLEKAIALKTIGSRAGRTSSFVRGNGP
ncbi:MAG: hypothetical protein JNL58_04440 [Planctomyces sp.]|nr:hypothetical protein [Planctomyces sp.]